MTFDKEKVLFVLQRKEVLFSDKLNPVELLPYLSLTDMSKQEIKCEQNNYGEKRATSLLLKRINQQDKCLVEFIKALRDLSQNDLADLLDPCHIITDTGQGTDGHTISKTCMDWAVTQKSTGPYYGKTPIKQLPCVVMEHLQKMDYDEKWRDLAGHLGYTIEDVQKLQSTSKSCTKQIMEGWYDATIDDLYNALHAVGRLDITTELEKRIGYKSLFSGEPFIDIQENQKEKQNGFTSIIKTCKTDEVLEEGEKTGVGELIYSRKQIDESQKSNFISSQDYISEGDITHPVSKVSDTRTQPFSVENNALQSISDRENEIEKNNKDKNHIIFKSTEDAGKQDCVSNNNIVFQEKTMKDKVSDHSHVILGATVIGAFAAGLFAFCKSS